MCCALVLVMQPWKAFPDNRFRERRVRPLCHLLVRQQTRQKIINAWQPLVYRCGNRECDFQAWPQLGVICRPVTLSHRPISVADGFILSEHGLGRAPAYSPRLLRPRERRPTIPLVIVCQPSRTDVTTELIRSRLSQRYPFRRNLIRAKRRRDGLRRRDRGQSAWPGEEHRRQT